jgi:MFS family permease
MPVPGTAGGADARTAARGNPRGPVTFSAYAALTTWAWCLYGFGALLPLLRVEEGTNRTVMGLHSLMLSGGAVVSGLISVRVIRRFRRRGVLRAGPVILTVGVLLLCTFPSPFVTLPAALLMGVGGSLMINSANGAMGDHHPDASAGIMSEANAVAASTGMIAPLVVGAADSAGLTWRPAPLCVILLAAVMLLIVRRIPADTPAVDAPVKAPDGGGERLPRFFWAFAGLVMVCVGIEFACTAWTADLLQQRTGMSPSAASAGLTTVVGGMAVGRVTMGFLARRFSPGPLMLGTLVLTALGWIIAWPSTGQVPAMAGFCVIGLGLAGQYPLGVAMLYNEFPHHGDQALSRLSIGVGSSAALAPFVLGALADATSTHTAFLVVPVMIVAASVLFTTIVRRGRHERAKGAQPEPDGTASAAA